MSEETVFLLINKTQTFTLAKNKLSVFTFESYFPVCWIIISNSMNLRPKYDTLGCQKSEEKLAQLDYFRILMLHTQWKQQKSGYIYHKWSVLLFLGRGLSTN